MKPKQGENPFLLEKRKAFREKKTTIEKMKPKQGDLIEVVTKDKTYQGVYIPQEGSFVIKLKSGYNIGIDKKKIKSVKIIKRYSPKKEVKVKMQENKKLPTISILHTGGTVASKVDYETGAVTARFSPEEILGMFPELKEIANIKSRLVMNILSENIRFSDFNHIAKEIAKEKTDGVIVTHGTDTLGYSAAALSFILEDVSTPVILVGAQRSSDRGSSDAALNLICAANFIAKTDFSGVAICMHAEQGDNECLILPALKTRKLHSSRRDAFKPVNIGAIAKVDIKGEINFLTKKYNKRSDSKIKLKLFKENMKVGILKAHPNLSADEIKIFKNFDGLVIEGTGLGNLPVENNKENEKVLAELQSLAKKIPVVMTTQTVFGRVDMNVYSAGRRSHEAGVLGNYNDMLTETAFIKLAWLLSNHPKQVRELIGENLRGEISSRTEDKAYL